ncbi:MAG: hypothetical protein ACLTAS_14790 [Butyribacter sp.]
MECQITANMLKLWIYLTEEFMCHNGYMDKIRGNSKRNVTLEAKRPLTATRATSLKLQARYKYDAVISGVYEQKCFAIKKNLIRMMIIIGRSIFSNKKD